MSLVPTYKVVLLGEGRVGKTSLLLRYVNDVFNDKQPATIQASYLTKRVNVDGTSTQLAVWDTAGQERFHALGPIYYRDADAALLVYDITDVDSFARVKNWVKELRQMAGKDIIIALVGNKIDMERHRRVTDAEANEYAASVGAELFGTSAKADKGVDAAFAGIAKRLHARRAAAVREGRAGVTSRRGGLTIVDEKPGRGSSRRRSAASGGAASASPSIDYQLLRGRGFGETGGCSTPAGRTYERWGTVAASLSRISPRRPFSPREERPERDGSVPRSRRQPPREFRPRPNRLRPRPRPRPRPRGRPRPRPRETRRLRRRPRGIPTTRVSSPISPRTRRLARVRPPSARRAPLASPRTATAAIPAPAVPGAGTRGFVDHTRVKEMGDDVAVFAVVDTSDVSRATSLRATPPSAPPEKKSARARIDGEAEHRVLVHAPAPQRNGARGLGDVVVDWI